MGGTSISAVYLGSELVYPTGLPIGTTFDFNYTGTVLSVELPKGKYKLLCWGALGGTSSGSSNGESCCDYLTCGDLDSQCTRSTYKTRLTSGSSTVTYTCDAGTHYVEFCYSKDGSVNTSPDNATVYIKSYQ